jgi:hypothetical protein
MVDDVVHVDIDDLEWGRVCSDGIILEIFDSEALVNILDIRANVLVPLTDIVEK